jgi:hypothetical protein
MAQLRTDFEIDGYANDPGRWGASLANNAEFLFGSLDAAGVRSVAEVGAYAGDLTRLLLDWAEPRGARVVAVDPDPKPPLAELEAQRSGLDLIRATSHVALAEMELTEAIILDGDHNYFTVAGELRLIAERSGDDPLPLILFHDVGWPHARRDSYEAIAEIPVDQRPHPVVEGGGLFPGEPGIRPGGLPMRHSAAREGGPRNGVLTAIEDFMASRDDLRLAIIPPFFGFGVLWQLDAPYAGALAELLDPWDGNPVLERLEANRVLHLASSHFQLAQSGLWRHHNERKRQLLQRLLISRSFRISQAISRVAARGEPAFTNAEIEALVADR